MKNQNKSFNSEDWDDFTHSSIPSELSNEQIFRNFKSFRSHFQDLPRNELVERGWLDSPDDSRSVARLFFALNADSNNALFRKAATAEESSLAMWVSLIRAKAEYVCLAQSMPQFQTLTKHDLKAIAQLSVDVAVIRELPALLAQKGVILVYLRALKGMKLDGVAFRLLSGHMVIGMSFRFPRLDYFWFTLMHELAHLVLHGDVLDNPVTVDVEKEASDINEKAANKLAKESFVDKSTWRNCEPKYLGGSAAVLKYARQERVHSSIVAGLLRKELGNYTRYSEIINEHNVRELVFER